MAVTHQQIGKLAVPVGHYGVSREKCLYLSSFWLAPKSTVWLFGDLGSRFGLCL